MPQAHPPGRVPTSMENGMDFTEEDEDEHDHHVSRDTVPREIPAELRGLPRPLLVLHQEFAGHVRQLGRMAFAVRIGGADLEDVAEPVLECAVQEGYIELQMLHWIAENMVVREKED